MLTLVGLGLWDEKDLTLRGIEAAKRADKAYIESYTGKWNGAKRLKEIIGKDVIELKREDLEQGAGKLINEAKDKDIAILVPGDPLVATTHSTIVNAAKEAGVKITIIHNSSIVSAIAETGLHIYKFGRTATVPFPEKTSGALPESVYDAVKENKQSGLHTLLLLDITPERCMTPNEAIETLLKIEKKRKENVFTEVTNAIVLARAGSSDSQIAYGRAADLVKKDFGKPPMVLIMPGKLHFTEKEYLERIL